MSFRRAQYAIQSVSAPTSANHITETIPYIWFKYDLFREGLAQHGAFFGIGWTKGLPWQTLKVVEGAARDFIMEGPVDWDARTMSVRVSI